MLIDKFGGPIFFIPRLVGAIVRRIGRYSSTFLYRWSTRSFGNGTEIQWGVRFCDPRTIVIGSNCLIWTGVATSSDGEVSSLILADNVEINSGVYIDQTASVEIGHSTLISEDSKIYTHDHGLDPYSKPRKYPKKIGSSVWIGARAIVLASCQNIGDGAVIGAGAVVTKNVEGNTVVAGVPAKVVRLK